MAKQYIFHTDPGHGWLAVKRSELQRLGIEDQISAYSYQRGGTVYLEEDSDAYKFIQAKKAIGEEVSHRESHQERTPIRGYEGFSPSTQVVG